MAVLADGEIIVGDGTTDPVAESGATARTSLGVAIGTNVQAWDADLDTLATAFSTASASGAASLAFAEDTDNGSNAVTLTGAASTADVTVTLPAATDTLVGKATTDVLTNKTLTSAVLNTAVSGSAVLDEDDLTTDSDTQIATQQSIKAYVDAQVATVTAGAAANLLINGDFRVAQRGTSYTSATVPLNSDDTWILDRWLLLSDGNDAVDVTQVAVDANGADKGIKLEVETEDKKFGILQILEASDSQRAVGGVVSVSFRAFMAASDDETSSWKAAVLSWDSTADAVTSDIISAWNADETIPTFVANWTAENTPAVLTLTDTSTEFKIENISVDTASTANIALFIWCDSADGNVDDAVTITNVKMEVGATASAWVPRTYAEELLLCQRYCFAITTLINDTICPGQNIATTGADCLLSYHTRMRADPTGTFSTASGYSVTNNVGTRVNGTVIAGQELRAHQARIRLTVAFGLDAGDATRLTGPGTTLTILDAEL